MPDLQSYNPFTGASVNGALPNRIGILGADGQPLRGAEGQREAVYGEFAVPHVVQFSSMIGQSWRTYWIGRHDEAQRAGQEEVLAMKRDAFLMGLLQERKLGTTSLKWRIKVDNERDPWQKAVKDGLTQIVQRTKNFQQLRYYLLEAIWYGRYGAQVVWEWADMKLPQRNGQAASQRVLRIKRHQPVNGDKIDFQWDGTPYLLIHGSQTGGAREAIPPGFRSILTNKGRAVLLDTQNIRQRFILHKHEVLDADFFDYQAASAVHGVGIRSTLFWLNWLRQEWLANVTDWCERTGLGVRLWYFQGGNKASRDAVESAAKAQSDKTNILVPRFGENAAEGVEYVDTTSSGADLLLRLMEHVEGYLERYVIGQTLSSDTEGSGLGGTGVADLHRDTKSNIIAFDANNFDDSFTADCIEVIKQWTFPDADFPAYFQSDIDQHDPAKVMEAVSKAFALGVDFRVDDVRSLTPLEAPQEGDETLMQVAQKKQEEEARLAMEQQGEQAKVGHEQDKEKTALSQTHELTKMGLEHGHAERMAGQEKEKKRFARYDRASSGHWITIGGHKGEGGKHVGGSPVYIEGGRITKGAPSLTGRKIDALKEKPEAEPEPATPGAKGARTRKERTQESGYHRAVWGKKAKAEGVEPKHLHQLAADFIAHDKELNADRLAMLQGVRSHYPHVKSIGLRHGQGKTDADSIKMLDDAADEAASNPRFAHLFAGGGEATDRLYDILVSGNPEPMSEEDAYQQAFDHLLEHKSHEPVSDEPIPFARRTVYRYAWNEKDHPRGQPENAGEFGPGGGQSKPESPSSAYADAHKAGKGAEKTPGFYGTKDNPHMTVFHKGKEHWHSGESYLRAVHGHLTEVWGEKLGKLRDTLDIEVSEDEVDTEAVENELVAFNEEWSKEWGNTNAMTEKWLRDNYYATDEDLKPLKKVIAKQTKAIEEALSGLDVDYDEHEDADERRDALWQAVDQANSAIEDAFNAVDDAQQEVRDTMDADAEKQDDAWQGEAAAHAETLNDMDMEDAEELAKEFNADLDKQVDQEAKTHKANPYRVVHDGAEWTVESYEDAEDYPGRTVERKSRRKVKRYSKDALHEMIERIRTRTGGPHEDEAVTALLGLLKSRPDLRKKLSTADLAFLQSRNLQLE